ncbi:hypothetical protein [Collimonas silvisoli]|uniref:hypothetical protein n=1 Tax=Collimonas silvisoli TaxID=2825884 RepID=UPI001B8D7B16|nr:hypothetical protein [Collimonas silvisoli]
MYLNEIEIQCEFAHRSFGQMQEIFANNPKHPSLLALAHMLLVFAGNVAKLLTSSDSARKTRTRAARLREALGVKTEDFSTIRRARNFFEHFDERLDKCIGETGGLVVHRLIDDHEPTSITLDDGQSFTPKFMQLLNTSTWELSLYDEHFSLPDVLRLLQEVQMKVKEVLRKQGVPGYEAVP